MPFSILDEWIQCFSRKNAVAKKSERDNVGIFSKLCQFSCKTLLKSAQFVDTEWSCSPGYPGDLFGRGSCDLQNTKRAMICYDKQILLVQYHEGSFFVS